MTISRQQLEEDLQNIVEGNWKKRNKLRDYFDLDQRRWSKLSLEKQAQATYCFQFSSKYSAADNSYATTFFGDLYFDGIGVEKNPLIAFNLYKQSAEKKNPWGLSAIGYYYKEGVLVGKDPNKALGYYLEAADQGYPAAMRRVGEMAGEAGHLDKKNQLVRAAANRGDPWALKDICLQTTFYINPFRYYAPQNIDIAVKIKAKEQQVVSGGILVMNGEGEGAITTHYKVTSYKVTIEYTGPINIGDRKIFSDDTLPNTYPSHYDSEEVANIAFEKARKNIPKILCTFSCCCPILALDHCLHGTTKSQPPIHRKSWFKDDEHAISIAKEIAANRTGVDLEESVANCIKKADAILTRRLERFEEEKPREVASSNSTISQPADNMVNIHAQLRRLHEQTQLLQLQIGQQAAPSAPRAELMLDTPPPAYSSVPGRATSSFNNFFKPNHVAVFPAANLMTATEAVERKMGENPADDLAIIHVDSNTQREARIEKPKEIKSKTRKHRR